MLYNVDLMEENEGIEHGEGRIVNDSSENDVFEVLKAVGLMDFRLCRSMTNWHYFAIEFWVRKVISVVCL